MVAAPSDATPATCDQEQKVYVRTSVGFDAQHDSTRLGSARGLQGGPSAHGTLNSSAGGILPAEALDARLILLRSSPAAPCCLGAGETLHPLFAATNDHGATRYVVPTATLRVPQRHDITQHADRWHW